MITSMYIYIVLHLHPAIWRQPKLWWTLPWSYRIVFQTASKGCAIKAEVFIFTGCSNVIIECLLIINFHIFQGLNQLSDLSLNDGLNGNVGFSLCALVWDYLFCLSFCLAGKPDVLHRKQPQQSSSSRFLPVQVWEWTHHRALWNARIPGYGTLNLPLFGFIVYLLFLYVCFCPVYIYITLLLNVSPSLICFHVLPLASPHAVKIGLRAYFTFLSCLLPSAFEDHNLSEVNCYSEKPSETELKALLLLLPLFLSFHVFWSPVYCLAPLWGLCEGNLECRAVLWPCSLQWKVRTVIHNAELSN